MSSAPSDSETSAHDASEVVDRLDRRIIRWLHRQGWTSLREIQTRAIAPILDDDKDVILAAGTASGKTEAAFLPIVSRILQEEEPSGIRVLYISPLKALINDQFRRLEELCESLEIPVHKWHGDVSSAAKKEVVRTPRGILLITPESLEAVLIHRGTQVPRMFSTLNLVVIDELHAFIGSERGRQLQSLLHRIEAVARKCIRRIGLSATLGDMRLAAAFLRPEGEDRVMSIESSKDAGKLLLQIRGHRVGGEVLKDEGEDPVERSIPRHLFQNLRGSNNLIFANSRARVEQLSDALRELCESERLPNEFFPHHGSLSKELREDLEIRLKDGRLMTTAVCTSTLEMGIDIGAVKSIAQVGPPHSVSALRQRLGRSGRRGDPAILRLYVEEPEIDSRSPLQDALRPQLVQSIAMIELLLEGWCEPPPTSAIHGSTLVQQLLSSIAQFGGLRASAAYRLLCREGPFELVDATSFGALLRKLGEEQVIAQMDGGTLILGEKGERLVNHYSFYSAFQTPEEFRVEFGGKLIGTLQADGLLVEKSYILLGGKRWRVVHIREDVRVIEVVPAPGGKPPKFSGVGGSVHGKVRERMHEIYLRDDTPPFLDKKAADLLQEGRERFRSSGLETKAVIRSGSDSLLFLWTGDREMTTAVAAFLDYDLAAEKDGIAIRVENISSAELSSICETVGRRQELDALQLAELAKNKIVEKFDYLLPADLLDADFASRALDIPGALSALRTIRS